VQTRPCNRLEQSNGGSPSRPEVSVLVATDETTRWGRVDEDGTVYVREGDAERAVGQYPDAPVDEALAYFERKFVELEGQVALLEQRVRGGAPARDLSKAIDHLTALVTGANAVGDLASLVARLARLTSSIGELTEQQSEESKAQLEAAKVARAAIVAEMEQLAAQDPTKAQWKQTGARVDELFAAWQEQQKAGPRLPKAESDELWTRFRAARATIDTHRKAYFSELDSAHKDARSRKQSLIEKAEALAPKGSAAIVDYRRLLDDWKLAGRAGKKSDDALWERFKAAGDAIYAAKSAEVAREDEEYSGNLTEKLALLEEAEKLLTSQDRTATKDALLGIQRRWDAIGKVPRDRFREVEDRLRKVENHVRKLDQDRWDRTDPVKEARQSDFTAQLTAKIAKLEQELADATSAGDKKKVKDAEDALAAQRVWLDALGD